ncbi:MAG: HEAT repeat domain-containing protein [Acidimicrobiia bacterium]|nr:HEAT repeat domain-containing protein [Acidimicrobiia bacterium]
MTLDTSIGTHAEATRVLGALAAAYNTFKLYPSPLNQPAFDRALGIMGELGTRRLNFEVGPSGFLRGDEPLAADSDGVERLWKRLFIHEVDALTVVGEVSGPELVLLFEAFELDEKELRLEGGMQRHLAQEDVSGIQVSQRDLLNEDEDDAVEVLETEEDLNRLTSEEIAAQFMAMLAEQDPMSVARAFVEMYRNSIDAVRDDDFLAREETVKAFVDAFFMFDDRLTVSVIETLLEDPYDGVNQMFLDQFSGHDFAQIAGELGPSSQQSLIAYARVTAETANGTPEELLVLLQSADSVRAAREEVSEHIAEVLGGARDDIETSDDAFSNLIPLVTAKVDYFAVGLQVLRGLLTIEHRPDRFRRVVRIWTGRISLYIRRGKFRKAKEILVSITENPPYPAERKPIVVEAVDRLLSADLIDGLVAAIRDEEEGKAAVDLLATLGSTAIDTLIEHLAKEEDANKRRTLIDLVALAARTNPKPVLDHIHDERWYVVRNIATVLGKVGGSSVIGPLKVVLRHDDHRVRVEALRAAQPVMGKSAFDVIRSALSDSHERVRRAAIGLLRSSDLDEADEVLVEALGHSSLDVDERLRVVEALKKRDTPTTIAALESAAGKVAVGGTTRQVKAAAKKALETP